MSKELPRHGKIIKEVPQDPFFDELKHELTELGVPENQIDERARKEIVAAHKRNNIPGLFEQAPNDELIFLVPRRIRTRPHTPRIKNKIQVVVTKTKPRKGL